MTAPGEDRGVCFGVRAEDWQTIHWVVEVNEAKVLVTGRGDSWWASFRQVHDPRRCRTVTASPGGDLVHVAADDEAHADWLRQTMINAGLPTTAVTLRRLIGQPR